VEARRLSDDGLELDTTLCRPRPAPTRDKDPNRQLVSVPFRRAEPAGTDRIAVRARDAEGAVPETIGSMIAEIAQRERLDDDHAA
jgi:hypothetical protein